MLALQLSVTRDICHIHPSIESEYLLDLNTSRGHMHRYVYKSSVFTIKTEVLKILLVTGEDQAIACRIGTFSWLYRFVKWLCSYSCAVIFHLAHIWRKSDLEWSRKHNLLCTCCWRNFWSGFLMIPCSISSWSPDCHSSGSAATAYVLYSRLFLKEIGTA